MLLRKGLRHSGPFCSCGVRHSGLVCSCLAGFAPPCRLVAVRFLYRRGRGAAIQPDPLRTSPCHVRGASQILSELEQEVGIAEGETSDDLEYTLESVACIGCCALAPCLKVNGNVHGDMTVQKVEDLFDTE